jgi:hypothetical protein
MNEVTSDSLSVITPRRRGRPRVEQPRSSVSTWIPANYHDLLIKIAAERETSVSALVRSLVLAQLQRGR